MFFLLFYIMYALTCSSGNGMFVFWSVTDSISSGYFSACIWIYFECEINWIELMGFGLVNRFIDHSQVVRVITNNYYTITDFHTKSSHATFTALNVVRALHNGYSSAVSNLNYGDYLASVAHWLTLHSWTLTSQPHCTPLHFFNSSDCALL
jgi:hypothetical protein